MKLTSSQRWAIGAVALALLIACSPRERKDPIDPSQPTGPVLSQPDAG